MNRIVGFGLAAVAVVAVVLVGAQLFNSSGGGLGGEANGSPEASAAEPSVEPNPSPSADAGLPLGPFAWVVPARPPVPPDDGPAITITIPAPGWSCPDLGGFCALVKGEDVDNVPESALLFESTTAGFLVYGDPCQWESSTPETPATSADEIVAALAAQPSRDASDPVDVTVDGYHGRMVTLHVPEDAGGGLGTSGFSFEGCNGGEFASYGLDGFDEPRRWHQGPGQIDDFWVVDVDDAVVVIMASYRPDTPADRIAEMRTMAESATFGD